MIYLRRKICVRPYLHHPSSSIPGIRASWEDNTYIGGDDDDNDITQTVAASSLRPHETMH